MFAVAPRPIYIPELLLRDRKYLAFVREHSCMVRGCKRRWVESAHTGPHGTGLKASDDKTVPLCRWHHRQAKDSLHDIGPVKFQALHRISFPEKILELRSEYERRHQGGIHTCRCLP